MKLLTHINERLALKGKPFSLVEIDDHDNAEDIWATIAQCKREAEELVREAWQRGYWDGQKDRDRTYD